MSHLVRAEGAGSIAVGGDAINSIFVTGGVNQFFVGQYERLADAYLSPRSLYRELNLDQFAGREWLLGAIDDFVSAAECGYFVIEAEAGMGKTAFMAWLARKRHYVHHFVRLMPDTNDVGLALRSLSAQLIRAWDLQAHAVGGILPTNASRPDFFEDLLYETAEKRDATRPGEAVVITIDGLNETVSPAGQNPLALPAVLPPGVYVVVSQRTTHVPFAAACPRRVARISPRSAENMADIRAYLESAVDEPRLRRQIDRAGMRPADVVGRLVEWSSGIWLVLRYVLAELRGGVRTVDDLRTVPAGLWQYYARFWVEWQREHEDHWAETDLPLLMTLSAVQEPVPLTLLGELSGLPDVERAALLTGDAWRPFLQVHEGPEELYRLYHDSLVEFVAGQVDVGTLTAAERSFVGRLVSAHRIAHRRIGDRYLSAWGGVAGALPGLRGEGSLMDGGYGLRHLIVHLMRGNADEVVHRVLELEWPREELPKAVASSPAANSWYEAHRTRREFAGYALDVERAWSYAEQTTTAGPTAPRGIALEFRYALMSASINSVTGNVPTELLVQLIDHGLLTLPQAIDLVKEAPDPRLRVEAFATLLPLIALEGRDDIERAALSNAQAVPDGYWRAGELVRLVSVVAPGHLAEIERLADAMNEGYYRGIVRAAVAVRRGESPQRRDDLAPRPASSLDPEDPRVFADQYQERTERAVASLAVGRRLESAAGPTALARALEASRFIRQPRWRAQALLAVARQSPSAEHAEILRVALAISLTVGDGEKLAEAVRAIEEIDDAEAHQRLTREAGARLGAPPGAGDIGHRAGSDVPAAPLPAVVHLTWQAEGLARAGDLTAAFELAARAPGPEARVAVLLRIAHAVGATGQSMAAAGDPAEQARLAWLSVATPATRSQLVVPVTVALAAAGRIEAVLDLVEGLSDDARAGAMLALAGRLPVETADRALTLARGIADPAGRARVLASLTPLVVGGGSALGSDGLDPQHHQRVQDHVRDVLHLLAAGTRSQLAEAVPDLVPGVVVLAGHQGLVDVAAAIGTARRWWP